MQIIKILLHETWVMHNFADCILTAVNLFPLGSPVRESFINQITRASRAKRVRGLLPILLPTIASLQDIFALQKDRLESDSSTILIARPESDYKGRVEIETADVGGCICVASPPSIRYDFRPWSQHQQSAPP